MDGEGAHLDVAGQAVVEMLPAVVVARPPEEPASIWCLLSSCPVRRAGVDSRGHADLLRPSVRSSLAPRERAQNLSLLLSMHPPSHSIGPRSCLLPRKEIRVMDCCAHEGRGDARFEIQKVADGVHVAVAAPAYKVNSNTAIIESDDGVVIVDTHSKPSAARVIVERLRDITTKPVRYVVNTHFHWDHWHGNEVYPAAYPRAEIVTNQLTREAMVTKGLKRVQDHVRQVPREIAQLKADLAVAGAPAERAKLEASVRLAESYLAEVKALKPALPTIAFEQTMKLYRRDREKIGRAHV